MGGTSSSAGFRKLVALWRSWCEGYHVALKYGSYSSDDLNLFEST